MTAKIEEFAGRLALIAIFGFLGMLALHRFHQLLVNPWSNDSWLLDVVSRGASFLFVLLVISATLVRLPARNTATGWEPRVSAILGTFFTLVLVVLPKGQISPEVRAFAVVLIICGTALSIYCLWWLGRSFSVMAHARRLVTQGPYRLVRHPLYAAEMVTLVGVAIANYSIAATVVIAITIAFQFRRMVNEERVLREAFAEYDSYAKRVPMVIPGAHARRLRASP